MIISAQPMTGITAFAVADVAINETNFPDATFRDYVKENCDLDGNGVLSAAELSSVTEMYVSVKDITTIKGIEYFTSLDTLDCSFNNLTSLDVSKNTALTYLDCSGNELTSLNVSKNIALEDLSCSVNQLTSLDVSKNTELEDLLCGYNQLTSLDVSKNTELISFHCSDNQFAIEIDEKGTFNLFTLPGNFDVSKAIKWFGGSINGNILTVNKDAKKVSYTYDMGNGKSATFTLIIKSSEPIVKIGDINGDNEITIVDAKWILQSVVGIKTLNDTQKTAADLNKDGNVTIVDAKWILQIVVGLRDATTLELK